MSESTDTHSLALPAGTPIDKYVVESILGAGGFGITYLAKDQALHRNVAMKECIPVDLAIRGKDCKVVSRANDRDEDFEWAIKKFIDEGKMLAKFRHPNIITVHDIFLANGTAYLVAEYKEGMDLAKWRKAINRPATEDEIYHIILLLLSGLEYVHEADVLHRDIKPENIYIRNDFSPVLLDFGSARQLIGNRSRPVTAIITPGYAPFEQYHDDGDQGPWTDIYALGAVTHFLITGEAPTDAAKRVRKDSYIPLAQRGLEEYSGRFLDAIDLALRPHEQERPQSAHEWYGILTECQTALHSQQPIEPEGRLESGSEGAFSTYDPAETMAEEPILKDKTSFGEMLKKKPALLWGTGATVAIAAIIIAAVVLNESEPPPPPPPKPTPPPVAPPPKLSALDQLIVKAKSGDVGDYYRLGMAYLNEIITKVNNEKAYEWLKKAAVKGHPMSQFMIGEFYREGKGVQKNYEQALQWYKQALEHKDAAVTKAVTPKLKYFHDVGTKYIKGDRIAPHHGRAEDWYTIAAKRQYVESQVELGDLFGTVKVPKELDRALFWYEKAVSQGSSTAKSKLSALAPEFYKEGLKYFNGDGVPKNNGHALTWFKRASDYGYDDGALYLAHMYYYDMGTTEKGWDAYKIFEKLAANGNVHSKYYLGLIYKEGKFGITESDAKAERWWKEAASAGNKDAIAKLNEMKPTMRPPIGRGTHIAIGSTKDEVLKVQGEPDDRKTPKLSFRIPFRRHKIWEYGDSEVKFEIDGTVAEIENDGNNLHPSIKLGDPKSKVLTLQGPADIVRFPKDIIKFRMYDKRWIYGKSEVRFSKAGIVTEIINKGNNLKLFGSSQTYFNVGSTRNDVIRSQGITEFKEVYLGDEIWYYGRSKIIISISTGRVISLSNEGENLFIR